MFYQYNCLVAKVKVKCLNQIVSKRLTNDHDLERVNVKSSFSYGEEEIEMSAILHDLTVRTDQKVMKICNLSVCRLKVEGIYPPRYVYKFHMWL